MPVRVVGTVKSIRNQGAANEFGFIDRDDAGEGEKQIYFKAGWFSGSPALTAGERVSFYIKTFEDGNITANHLLRLGGMSDYLTEWANLGSIPETLEALGGANGLALKERWEFRNTPPDQNRPHPILHSYVVSTFQRLVLEEKVKENNEAGFAAFNTGLVDQRYESIYALFQRSDHDSRPWRLTSFCIAGEGTNGQNLVRYFNPLPPAAHYFQAPIDLLYDPCAGKLELDWNHIIVENIRRYPREFIEDNCPKDFELCEEPVSLSEDGADDYYARLGNAIVADARTYRSMMNRLKDAIDLSLKRVLWNYKTAVPQYYPTVRKLQLLLPICLVSDEEVDIALAVERTDSGTYLGHTILPLDWAYRNARLICRPDSDWLAPETIDTGQYESHETTTDIPKASNHSSV